MKNKKKQKYLMVGSIFCFAVGYALAFPEVIGLCNNDIWSCIDFYERFAEPLVIFSLLFFLLSIIFFFISEYIFNVWKKFAVWYIPIAGVLIALSSPRRSGFYPMDTEIITWFLAGLFAVVSILIIIITWWRNRGRA